MYTINQYSKQCLNQNLLDFGLTLKYEAKKTTNTVEIDFSTELKRTLHGKTCGLCGNQNGDDSDDLITKGGKTFDINTASKDDIFKFGESWAHCK